MQLNSNILSYERITKNNKKDNNAGSINRIFIIKLFLYVLSSFFISRVMMIDSIAPFGIAYAVVLLNAKKNDKISIISSIAVLLGYVSIYNELKDFGMYIIATLIAVVISLTLGKLETKKRLFIIFGMILVEFTIFKFFALRLPINSSLLFSFLQLVCIVSVYYILNYSVICFENINSRHLFSNEEIISMAVMVSIVISGTKGASLYDVSFRNVLSMLFIVILSYVSGGTVGAAVGIALGAIIGINTDSMLIYISILGLCALVVGIFKELGKVVSGISFFLIISILILYCSNHGSFNFKEVILTCVIFFILPGKIYDRIEAEFNWGKKQDLINEMYADRVKDVFVNRLNNFSNVLFTMSNILDNFTDNDRLELKTKSCGIIENLADRVCSGCNMKAMCWKRETYYTYAAFEELIQNFQDNNLKIPEEIERKCVKRSLLFKSTESIVNSYINNEMLKLELSKGREVMSSQINNMGSSLKEILSEFNEELKFNSDMERTLMKMLSKNNVEFKNLICLESKKNRPIIKMTMNACGGRQICVKEVLPIINKVVGKVMCVSDDGCSISPESNLCSVVFEEAPKYYVASYVGRTSKYGEKQNGDSYSFEKLKDGNYMVIISDGMGFGAQAEKESKAVIDLIEKFTSAGIGYNTAINAVNSVMSLKFNEDEKFSTVDLCNIDLYSGEAEFLKVGAVSSFVKRKNKIQSINSKTLPIGVLDKADVEVRKLKVQNGDIVVMVSDGVIDSNHGNSGNYSWLVEFLSKNDGTKPKELSEAIIKKALQLCGGKAEDDMTVIVSKVYNLY